MNCEHKPGTHSAWSRFRMSLWALRVAILGKGPWLLIRNEENLLRLCNSARKRGLVSDQLARSASLQQAALI